MACELMERKRIIIEIGLYFEYRTFVLSTNPASSVFDKALSVVGGRILQSLPWHTLPPHKDSTAADNSVWRRSRLHKRCPWRCAHCRARREHPRALRRRGRCRRHKRRWGNRRGHNRLPIGYRNDTVLRVGILPLPLPLGPGALPRDHSADNLCDNHETNGGNGVHAAFTRKYRENGVDEYQNCVDGALDASDGLEHFGC